MIKNFQMMALYNQRINKQLLDICLALPVDMQEKETHSFFSNIISYWNHILFGDLILLGRLARNNVGLSEIDLSELPSALSPQDIYADNLSELQLLRIKVDQLIVQFCENLTQDECEKRISYQTTEGQLVTKVAADIIQHLFNHQTHHRGQLTCILSQFGIDYGCMDLPIIVSEGSR